MKNQRQKAIMEIINQYEVDTQQYLVELLCAKGFAATQATVSRDIKDMSLIKVAAKNQKYKYAMPNSVPLRSGVQRFYNVLHDSIISIDVAGNLVVIKTYPGMANAVCAVMDEINFDGFVGSIAGDDTIFLAISTEEKAVAVQKRLTEIK